jgi:CheY-like chemotaxis protein
LNKCYRSQAMIDDTRLLVVDDEDVVCRGCRRLLAREGYRVRTSTNAKEGLNLAKEWDYDAIVLDIKMPDLDGIEFLEELRAMKPDVPVIIITGYPSPETEASAKRLGAAHYVTKPFTPERITQAVRELLPPENLKGWL